MKLLTPLLLLIVSFGLFFVYIKPQYEKINGIREQISQYDSAIERSKLVGEKRNELLNRRNGFTAEELARLQKFLPDNIDTIRLIIDIDSIANSYNAELSNIKISSASETASANPTTGQSTVAYGTMNLQFNVPMTYNDFQEFLSDLEKNLRLSDVASVSFSPKEDGATYDYNVTLATYWLK